MLPTHVLYILVAQTAIVIVTVMLLLLPAAIELKKPKDSGPRLIKDKTSKIRNGSIKINIANIEEEEENQSITHIDNFLYRFPNLEN